MSAPRSATPHAITGPDTFIPLSGREAKLLAEVLQLLRREHPKAEAALVGEQSIELLDTAEFATITEVFAIERARNWRLESMTLKRRGD